MKRNMIVLSSAAVLLSAAAFADGTVSPMLSSPQAGQTVATGATIHWTVSVSVSGGDNAGLAGVAVDLVQDAGNPALFDVPPGNAASIPAVMTAHFDRPAGIANPGEGGANSGYVGVQRGTAGQKNLVQIGGVQNTFGQAGSSIGTEVNVAGGIGQSAAQMIVSGSFAAPSAVGTYTFSLANAAANLLVSVSTPPDFSPVTAPAFDYSQASFSFSVAQYATGDLNCDGTVDLFDIDPFVVALTSSGHTPAFDDYLAQFPNCNPLLADVNGDAAVDLFDIDPFVILLTGP